MDFEGQKLSERLAVFAILFFAAGSFVLGYLLSSFRTMMLTFAGGVAMAFVISVPDWPYFNQHPLKWLDPIEQPEGTEEDSRPAIVKGKTTKKGRK